MGLDSWLCPVCIEQGWNQPDFFLGPETVASTLSSPLSSRISEKALLDQSDDFIRLESDITTCRSNETVIEQAISAVSVRTPIISHVGNPTSHDPTETITVEAQPVAQSYPEANTQTEEPQVSNDGDIGISSLPSRSIRQQSLRKKPPHAASPHFNKIPGQRKFKYDATVGQHESNILNRNPSAFEISQHIFYINEHTRVSI